MKCFVFSDPHGDHDRLCQLLIERSLINSNHDWIAGESKLICCGDLVDRGKQGIEVIELLMKLEGQASKVNGEVISLMGNHDLMILAYASIINNEFYDRDCVSCFRGNGGAHSEAEIIASNFELRNWLKNRPFIYKLGDYLFQHCDSCKYYLNMSNERTIKEINSNGKSQAYTGIGAWEQFCLMCDNRYFDRPFLLSDDQLTHVDHYLDIFDAKFVVHGHTPIRNTTSESAQHYFNGKIINVDGVMSNGYRNDPDRGFIMELEIDF